MLHRYVGSPRDCGERNPHQPHVVGEYLTVRFGWLEKFCPGRPGPGQDWRIVSFFPGGPDIPGAMSWVEPADSPERPRYIFLGERVYD